MMVVSLLKRFLIGNGFALSCLLFLLFIFLNISFSIDLFMVDNDIDDEILGDLDVDDGESGDGVKFD
jgi:hypothetical protein